MPLLYCAIPDKYFKRNKNHPWWGIKYPLIFNELECNDKSIITPLKHTSLRDDLSDNSQINPLNKLGNDLLREAGQRENVRDLKYMERDDIFQPLDQFAHIFCINVNNDYFEYLRKIPKTSSQQVQLQIGYFEIVGIYRLPVSGRPASDQSSLILNRNVSTEIAKNFQEICKEAMIERVAGSSTSASFLKEKAENPDILRSDFTLNGELFPFMSNTAVCDDNFKQLCRVQELQPEIVRSNPAVAQEPINTSPSPDQPISMKELIQPRDTREFQTAVSTLDADVFIPYMRLNYKIKVPLYSEKEGLMKIVKSEFMKLSDVGELVALYDYVNEKNKKAILNIHNHWIYDTLFFKSNTKSWENFVKEIREYAFKKLLIKAGISDELFVEFNAGRKVNFVDPQFVINTLNQYIDRKLFSEHRSNDHFRNLFHATSTVKTMRKIIELCEQQLENRRRYTF